MKIPKINSNRFGGAWIAVGLALGIVIPAVVWFIWHLLLVWMIVAGGVVLAAFAVLFAIEMHQDNSKIPYYERHLAEEFPFDPATQEAVIKSSICTGESVAGFRNKADGHFVEVMMIRTAADEERFKKIYGVAELKKIY